MLVLIIEVHDGREDEDDDRQVGAKLEHLALEQKVEVPIGAAVKHPVLHLKFVNDREEHSFENRESFRFCVKASLVHFLNIDVLVDGEFGCSQDSLRVNIRARGGIQHLPPKGSNQILFHSTMQMMR